MPRVVSVISAFTSGELSPSAYGRVDIARYANGMSCIRNYLPDPLGGLKRRAGTRFVCETRYSQFVARLIPFEFSTTAAYIFEVGCEYIRFYKHNALLSPNPELITNGTFDTDLSGWTETETGSATVSWVSGRASFVNFTGGPNTASLQQSAVVSVGAEYEVQWEIPSNSATGAFLRIGSTAGGSDYFNTTGAAVVSGSTRVVATTTTLSFSAGFTGANIQGMSLDNVSIKLTGPLELATPYNHGEVHNLDILQSADEQYWLHQCHPTRKLQRYGDSCWRFNCVTFTPPPTVEYGTRVQSSISAGATTGIGTTVTITAFNNSPAFLAADVGREIQVLSGTNAGARGGIKSIAAMTADVVVCVPWISTGLQCAGTWKISGSPMTTVTPETDVDPVGKSSTLTLSAAGWRTGQFGCASDVGKVAHINGGSYQITCVSSTTLARSIIRGVQSGTSAATVKGEAGAWSLEESLWSAERGYASTGDFHNDRLVLDANFRFCMSKTGDYENFGVGTFDDDAVIFAINSKTINVVRAIVGGKDLQIFTQGGEYSVTSDGAVITPTDVLVSAETTHGSRGIPPVRVGGRTTLFVDRSGKQLLEFTVPQDSISDQYVAPNLLLLAEHLTATTEIHEFVYQRTPQPIIWVVLESGELLSCTYRREENVVAWAKHNTCGLFESIGVMPHPDGNRDQLWVIVNRTINGATKRYVEYFDDSALGPYDRRYTDASVTFSCTSATRLTGLTHLECAYVQVLADGAFLCTAYVVNGEVKLSDSASVDGPFEVGLPYTSEGVTLPPEVAFGAGSIQPMAKRWARVFLRTRDSCSMVVRTGTAAFEHLPAGESVGNGVRDHVVPRLSDFFDGRITFRQENPLPSHVLMVGGTIDINPD